MFAARGWVEEHWNRSETECSNQGRVKLGRHWVKNEDSVTYLDARVLQECSGSFGLQVEIGEAQRPVVALADVQDCYCIGVHGGTTAKSLSNVHGETCLANSV